MSTALNAMLRRTSDRSLIVTPRLEEFLLKSQGNVELDDDDFEQLKRLAQPRYTRDRVFTASVSGSCPRFQVLRYLGAPARQSVDTGLFSRFIAGTWGHFKWQIIMHKAGIIEISEEVVRSEKWRFVTAIDGIGSDPEPFLLEIKTSGRPFNRIAKNGPEPYHLLQAHKAMLFRRPKIDTIVLFYEDKQTNDYKEFVVRRDEKVMNAVKEEMRLLNRSVDEEKLPEILEDCRYGRSQTFKSCPFGPNKVCPSSGNWPTDQDFYAWSGG